MFRERISSIQSQYYNNYNKKCFLKNNQKLDCASYLCQHIDINELIEHTVYYIPFTNNLVYDYTIFKHYANPEMYTYFNNHFINLFQYGIDTFETVNLYIQIETFTISAFDRYRNAILQLIDMIPYGWILKCDSITLFNCPSMIEHIMNMLYLLLDKQTKANLLPRLTLLKKDDSNLIYDYLHN